MPLCHKKIELAKLRNEANQYERAIEHNKAELEILGNEVNEDDHYSINEYMNREYSIQEQERALRVLEGKIQQLMI